MLLGDPFSGCVQQLKDSALHSQGVQEVLLLQSCDFVKPACAAVGLELAEEIILQGTCGQTFVWLYGFEELLGVKLGGHPFGIAGPQDLEGLRKWA